MAAIWACRPTLRGAGRLAFRSTARGRLVHTVDSNLAEHSGGPDCTLCLPGRFCPRRDARLDWQGGGWLLTGLHSASGRLKWKEEESCV